MHEAQFYVKEENDKVRCTLCPWYCLLNPNQTGNCKVRFNKGGKLFTEVYNKIAAFGIDPIEKKPLYHFYPGKNIVSIGEVGCNLHCTFCQNHRISQCSASDFLGFNIISSEKLVSKALFAPENIGIAYTYNEPFTFYEFLYDTAKLAHEKGLKNVVVSNGYINPEPLTRLLPLIDAFNIDLKAFTEDFYKRQTRGKLQPVMETIKTIAQSGAHLEITNLVIPGLNDNKQQFKKMITWISEETGNEVPLHLSRYFPNFEANAPVTPGDTLESFYELAKQKLKYVYLGNVNDELRSSTFCPECNELLIRRNHYKTVLAGINNNKTCKTCGTQIKIVL
jgi:pyruvate formate lyase activating enzyme